MRHHLRLSALVFFAAIAILLSGCGSSDSAEGDASTPDPTDAAAPQDTDADTPTQDDGGQPIGESGSGVVSVDGVEYPGFAGSCSVHRGLDPETYKPVPVGDLAEPGLLVVVGIDNVASSPAVEANFIMVGATDFRMAGLDGSGSIDSIAYVGPEPSGISTELATVAFSGTTDEGAAVVAEVVCEVGLG